MSTHDRSAPHEMPTLLQLTRDQRRMQDAYKWARAVHKNDQDDYKIAVHHFGATLLRSGLAAAMASLERRGGQGNALMVHLAEAQTLQAVLAQSGAHEGKFSERVCGLGVGAYMTASREMLELVKWLKRAVQATFDPKEQPSCGER